MFNRIISGVGCGMIGFALAYTGSLALTPAQLVLLIVGGTVLVITRKREHGDL